MKPGSPAVCACGGTHRSAPATQAPRSHAQCCGRYIEGSPLQVAPDAESLMRSRYTAYVREDAAYLRATWHASRRPATLNFEPGCKWPRWPPQTAPLMAGQTAPGRTVGW